MRCLSNVPVIMLVSLPIFLLGDQVMPTIMSPKVTAVTRLSRCLPPFAPLQRNQYPRSNTRHGATPANSHAAAQSVEHLVQAVPTSAAVIVYGFNSADQLVKGLSAAERVADSANSGDRSGGGSSGGSGSGLGVIGEPDDQRNCVLMRAAIPIDTDDSDLWARTEAGAGEASGHGNVGDGFGPAMANGLSRPVLADEMGETHLWVADSNGRRHLAAAFVSLQRATVFITLSPSAQFPPFRVENRSSTETLAYRQVGTNGLVREQIHSSLFLYGSSVVYSFYPYPTLLFVSAFGCCSLLFARLCVLTRRTRTERWDGTFCLLLHGTLSCGKSRTSHERLKLHSRGLSRRPAAVPVTARYGWITETECCEVF